jgi:hypothetical protein
MTFQQGSMAGRSPRYSAMCLVSGVWLLLNAHPAMPQFGDRRRLTAPPLQRSRSTRYKQKDRLAAVSPKSVLVY